MSHRHPHACTPLPHVPLCTRFELVVNDAEVKVGGMLCDRAHFDMLKSFAESEAKGAGATWAMDIDQDVAYVHGGLGGALWL